MRRMIDLSLLLTAAVLFVTTPANAQSSPLTQPHPIAFEVASIRPSSPDPTQFGYELSPSGRFSGYAMTVKDLIVAAYRTEPWNILGGPGWTSSKQFDINATIDPALVEPRKNLTEKQRQAQVRQMLQVLLAERFNLQVKRETKSSRIYALVLAKGGPKFSPSPKSQISLMESSPSVPEEPTVYLENGHFRAKHVTMAFWASQLSAQQAIQRTVLDETGLTEQYDFDFKLSFSEDPTEPSIFTALEEQLGLKLESRTGPVDVVVVEHVDPPSPN